MGGGGPCHLLCPQWESACQTPQPSAASPFGPGSGTTSRPGSIRRKLQPSGESSGSEPGVGASHRLITATGLPLLELGFKFIKLLQTSFTTFLGPGR